MKRQWFWCLLVLTLCGGMVSSSRAELTAFWIQRPISAAAITDDPILANMQSWSLMSSYDLGRWSAAGVRATLPPGHTFYHHPLGSNVAPNPLFIPLFPGLEFDTYVTDPLRTDTGILGGHPASPTASFGGPTDPIPGTFSVSWHGTLGGSPVQGTFEIARLTFPLGVMPHILQGPPAGAQSITYTILPEQEAFVGQIPDPAGLSAVLLGMLALVRRNKAVTGLKLS